MGKDNLDGFYRSWLTRLPSLVESYIYDENKRLYPTRYLFLQFKDILKGFLENSLSENEKIFIVPGIRGIGKTTLLMQLYSVEKFLQREEDRPLLFSVSNLAERLYLDVSKLRLENIPLNEFLKFYERVKNLNWERLDKKVLILLDEVHYDETWGLFLKNIFDRTKGHKNILVIASGSSALHLRMNPDLVRRSTVVEFYPLKFTEYLALKYHQEPREGLATELIESLFNSQNGEEVFRRLKEKSKEVDSFFSALPEDVEEEYFKVGGFPFTIRVAHEVKRLELIKNVIANIIARDILPLKKFKTQTLSKIGELLYLLANSDIISYEKLTKTLKIGEYRTINSLMETLILSGVITKVKSFGRYGGVRKTPKFLFIVPALRSAILDGILPPEIEGKKLEDYFSLLFHKDLKNRIAEDLMFDSAEGGADFILRLKNRKIVIIEVGFHKEEINQIALTKKKVKASYAFLFGSRDLALVDSYIVKIPLRYLLLI
ncbi:MAG: AAA family ATPase [candidate division WOR-3 bacterium]